MVTLNLNSAVWAKDDSGSDSQYNYRHSEIINGKENTKSNDNGNIQSNDNGNIQTSYNGTSNCDSQCQKDLDNAMGTLNNLIKPTLP